jgi:hypothetical protein
MLHFLHLFFPHFSTNFFLSVKFIVILVVSLTAGKKNKFFRGNLSSWRKKKEKGGRPCHVMPPISHVHPISIFFSLLSLPLSSILHKSVSIQEKLSPYASLYLLDKLVELHCPLVFFLLEKRHGRGQDLAPDLVQLVFFLSLLP